MTINTLCIYISSFSFFAYSISYFINQKMKNEFKRFGLEKLGLITILLEILGATGLLLGLYYKPLLLLSSLGLGLLMFAGFLVRIKIKDNIIITIPALFFCLLNLFIFYNTITN